MKTLAVIFLGVFVITSQVLRANAQQEQRLRGEQQGLRMTCRLSPTSNPPTAGFPVWLDVNVTNIGKSQFHGFFFGAPTSSIVATVPSSQNAKDNAAADMQKRYGWYDGNSTDCDIEPGKTYGFRVLLNSLLPITKPGTLSCQIMLPLGTTVRHVYTPVVLVALLTINVGSPLMADGVQAASNLIVSALENGTPYDRPTAHQEVKVLPDANAIPILMRVIKDTPSAWWAISDLASRPRTPETTAALQQLAHSSNADTRALVQKYLTQSNASK